MAAYNASATLNRALDSIANQTCLPAEVIIIDDASTDDTADIAKAHPLKNMTRVLVHRLAQNHGAAGARNAGWALATGDYIAFLDADDVWHPQKLARQCPVMADGTMLSGYRTPLRSTCAPFQDVMPHPVSAIRVTPLGILFSNPFNTSSIIVRRDSPFRFSTMLRRAEDYLLWCEVVRSGYKVMKLDTPLAFVFKDLYGQGGLSADLWAMQCGELKTYQILHDRGLLSYPLLVCAMAWSCLRYVRRVILCMKKRPAL